MNSPITYYRLRQPQISFHQVALHSIEAMRRLGYEVRVRDYQFNQGILNEIAKENSQGTALLHPLFYYANWEAVSFSEMMSALSKAHSAIYGIEVADSTAIAPQLVEWANHPALKGLFVPSQFSKDSFINSGVKTPVHVFPHGIVQVAPTTKFDFLKGETQPKLLTFLMGDPWRKGWDLIQPLLDEFPDILFVVKTNADVEKPGWVQEGNLLLIKDWLSEEDKTSLYQNCDIYLSPHRGGAFEINCLEALSYGLIVMATAFGGVMDYLNDENAVLLKDFEWVQRAGDLHSGNYAQLKMESLSQNLFKLLKEFSFYKNRAQQASLELKKKYEWKSVISSLNRVFGA